MAALHLQADANTGNLSLDKLKAFIALAGTDLDKERSKRVKPLKAEDVDFF